MTATTKLAVAPFARQLQRVETYAEINEIMRSADFRPGGSPERLLFQGDTLLLLNGDEHLQRKMVFAPLFTRDAMVYYESKLLDPQIDQVMAELRTRRGPDGLARTDLVPLIRAMLHRISARVTGVDGVDTPERTERFCQLVARMGAAASGQHSVRDPKDVVKDGLETLQALVVEFLQPSLDRRRELVRQFKAGSLKKEELPRDALTMICLNGDDMRSRQDDTPYYSYVWRESVLFLSASTQTTTHMLPHVFVHLDAWIKAHPEEAHKVGDPAFLRLAVVESLRLHQTSPVKFRVAVKDVTLSSGRKFVKDELVALDAPNANLEPGMFGADAAEFNPYREKVADVQPWGMTFGAGVHMCLGRSLVTGQYNRPDDNSGTEGTMVKILKVFYARGVELDPENPPKRITTSYHDAYEGVPIILRKL